MLEANNLCKQYGSSLVVDNVSLQLNKGEIVGFLGRNGAGKTTTIKMLAGQLAADSGSVRLLGGSVANNVSQLGYLPEGAPLWPQLTPRQSLMYLNGLQGQPRQQAASQTNDLIELLDLQGHADMQVQFLSKGYRRRTALALALTGEPEVLLLDEPFDGFDPVQRRAGRDLLRKLCQQKAILVCTHSLEEAESLCDRVLVLETGRIVANGKVSEICKEQDFETVFSMLTGNAS